MPASEIIASFAVGLGIIELLKMVGFVGAYGNPVSFRGSVDVFGVTVDYQRLIGVGAAFGAMLFLFVFPHHIKAGLALRGISRDGAAMILRIGSGSAPCGVQCPFWAEYPSHSHGQALHGERTWRL